MAKIVLRPNKTNFGAGEPVGIVVTVSNQGAAPVQHFWADLYINPSNQLKVTNQMWNERCAMMPSYGLVWKIEQSLAPG